MLVCRLIRGRGFIMQMLHKFHEVDNGGLPFLIQSQDCVNDIIKGIIRSDMLFKDSGIPCAPTGNPW